MCSLLQNELSQTSFEGRLIELDSDLDDKPKSESSIMHTEAYQELLSTAFDKIDEAIWTVRRQIPSFDSKKLPPEKMLAGIIALLDDPELSKYEHDTDILYLDGYLGLTESVYPEVEGKNNALKLTKEELAVLKTLSQYIYSFIKRLCKLKTVERDKNIVDNGITKGTNKDEIVKGCRLNQLLSYDLFQSQYGNKDERKNLFFTLRTLISLGKKDVKVYKQFLSLINGTLAHGGFLEIIRAIESENSSLSGRFKIIALDPENSHELRAIDIDADTDLYLLDTQSHILYLVGIEGFFSENTADLQVNISDLQTEQEIVASQYGMKILRKNAIDAECSPMIMKVRIPIFGTVITSGILDPEAINMFQNYLLVELNKHGANN